MEKLSHTDSRGMYSWWWNSHISPKNSKWLQENLTDMDVKVKSMIRLIEEDADSFARRAEMYYKKRPELMKMVEEFYRSYRALAERYDHATGVIRQAHHTMSEAFPDQVPSMLSDDSTRTPNGEFADVSDSYTEGKILKQFNDQPGLVGKVRRGLNFDELDEKEHRTNKISSDSYSEEILALKEAIAELEAEKKAGIVQMETEISKSREDFRMLTDRANIAENEVFILNEKLIALDAEKESKLQDYEKSVEKVNERANASEIEAQSLKDEVDKLVVEKDAALDQYMNCLEIISILQNKLRLTEEDAAGLKERAEKSESEIEILKQNISKLTEEKEAAARECQQCLELISGLEQKLSSANEEIGNGFAKLKSSEEQCLELERSNLSLQSELESLMSKFGTQTEELTEKQKELGRLWDCIEEERFRFLQAETAFQTLQRLHAQSQEELRDMASELQNRAHLLQVGGTQNRSLQDEIKKVKGENKHLDELNVSSSLSIKDMQNEISSLMESKGKLKEEVELRLDQRNALQQELYCLKEELKDMNKKHVSILDQVDELGLEPESLGSSVKDMRDENSCLKETYQRESSEKAVLLEKMEVLEQHLVKNSLLETSLFDLNAELEAARGKIEALEQLCRLFLDEKSALEDDKSTLVTQLQETNKNLEKEKESTLQKVDELNISLEAERIENFRYIQTSEAKIRLLQGECQQKKGDLDQVLDSALANELEVFVLGTTARVLKENNRSLFIMNQKLLEASDKKLLVWEQKDFEQQSEIRSMKKYLCKAEEENLELSVELSVLATWVKQVVLDLQNLEMVKNKIESEREARLTQIECLNLKIKDMKREKSDISEEKRSLMDNIRHLEGKNNGLEEENYVLCSKVLALENFSSIFRIFVDEKLMVFREIGDDRNKLHDVSASLIGKLEESKIENVDLKERLRRTENELSVEIESGRKSLNRIALQLQELQEAKEKISQAENEKLELYESVENLINDYNEIKTENNFLHEASEKLEVDLEKLRHECDAKKIEEENLHFVLQNKVNDINELEILGTTIFGQLHHLGVSQLVYEHKFHELSDVFDDYMDQNAVLKSQLSAFGPEIVLLKECISSLENQTDIHIKFPNPENEELQDAKVAKDQSENIRNEDCNKSMISSDASDLHILTTKLQAIVKTTTEQKDVMVQENTSLHSKLDDTIKQLEFLQSNQYEWHMRSQGPTSEIISEGENTLLTKDIILDQISDSPSYGPGKRQHQHWETSDPKKVTENNLNSFGEGNNNREKVLERLDSDVQKLENIQITVQDLKRKIEATEKGKRGKEVIECEALKRQLEETDEAVVKLFELNKRLVKSIDEMSFSDMENDGRERRRKVSKHAQRMSEKIGRLQLEVQKLQFVLLKVDEVKDKKSLKSVSKRTVLKDYLYGVGQRKKKKTAKFCACMQPSTVLD